MENNQLKDYFDLNHIEKVAARCAITKLSDIGHTSPAEGMDSQDFISATMTEVDNSDEITTGGQAISKTFFSNTHPGAYAKLQGWLGLTDEELKTKAVSGFIVTVPTKKEFVRMRRVRDESDPHNGELVPMVNSITKQISTATQMTFFVLKNENIVSELRRRGSQLEKLKGWLKPVTTLEVGSTADDI